MHAENIAKFIDNLIEHDETFDFRFLEWVRCAFTTLCLMENIDSDTYVCDTLIMEMYNDIEDRSCVDITTRYEFDNMTFNDFYNYMVEYMV